MMPRWRRSERRLESAEARDVRNRNRIRGGAWLLLSAVTLFAMLLVTPWYSGLEAAPEKETRNDNIPGPTNGRVGVPSLSTADARPVGVELPITYTWEATGQSSVVHVVSGTSDD